MASRLGAGLLALLAFLHGSAFAAGDPRRGLVMAKTWCSSCHLVTSGSSGTSTDAPPFATIAKRDPDDLAALTAFLANPHPPMPNLHLTRDEIADLLAYIASLR